MIILSVDWLTLEGMVVGGLLGLLVVAAVLWYADWEELHR